jgi:hypothetical protein
MDFFKRWGRSLVGKKSEGRSEACLPEAFSASRGEGGTAVIANGIPKSGTHLLYELVKAFGPWKGVDIHLNPRNYDVKDERGRVVRRVRQSAIEQICSVRNGQVFPAHFYYRGLIADELERQPPDRIMRHILIVRDPRDAMVSRVKWYHSELFQSDGEQAEFYRHWIKTHPDAAGQLDAVVRDHHADFLEYLGWLDRPSCLLVRYEDLMAELSSVRENGAGEKLKAVARHLDLEPDQLDWNAVAARSLQTGFTVSKEGGGTGRYLQTLRPDHLACFEKPEIKAGLVRLGYLP